MSSIYEFLLDLILDWDNIPSYEYLAPEPVVETVSEPVPVAPEPPVTVVERRPMGIVKVHSGPTESRKFYSQDAEGDRQRMLDDMRFTEGELPPEYPFHEFNYGP